MSTNTNAVNDALRNQASEAYEDATGTDENAVHTGMSSKSVYVYEAPVRIWHWINVAAILVLCLSGYFIGSPLPTQPGEASDNYLMGYIRFAHFTAGYIMAIGFVCRIYWAIVGNAHAREMFTIPFTKKEFWREVWTMIKWYAMVIPQPNRYVGHNPFARLMMVLLFTCMAVFMICTGFALYGEGTQAGSWANTLFSSWVIPLFGQSQDVHTWHHLGMWVLVTFIILHVYAAIREDIMGRQSVVSTMISGYRTFKDD